MFFTYLLAGGNGIGGAGRNGGPVEDWYMAENEVVCKGSFDYWTPRSVGSGYYQIPVVLCGYLGRSDYTVSDYAAVCFGGVKERCG